MNRTEMYTFTSGFTVFNPSAAARYSFSLYLQDLLQRENEDRAELLSHRRIGSTSGLLKLRCAGSSKAEAVIDRIGVSVELGKD